MADARSERAITVTRSVESGHGRVSVVFGIPGNQDPSDCMIIAHGAGSSMDSSLVNYFHSELAAQGFLSVKFNFPYAEGRLRFVRKPDRKEVLVECYRRIVGEALRSEWKPKNLFLGGISQGAAVASHVESDGHVISEVKGLFFLCYPIHLPGRPGKLGTMHLDKVSKSMIFISGTRDMYAEPQALKSVVRHLGQRARVHFVNDADHSFNKHKGKAIYDKTLREILEVLSGWASSVTSRKDH